MAAGDTYRFPPTGGTPWHDLDEDRPWFDPAYAADREQDLEAAALVAGERFGDLGELHAERYGGRRRLEREVYARAPSRVPHDFLVRPLWARDDDFLRRRRQADLNRALEHGSTANANRERDRDARSDRRPERRPA